MTPFLDDGYEQGDGSSCQWTNCVPSGCVDVARRVTCGDTAITAPQLRSLSGVPCSSGLTYTTAQTVTSKATGGRVVLTVKYWLDNAAVVDLVHSGRPTNIAIYYGDWLGKPWAGSASFTAAHNVAIMAYRLVTYTDVNGIAHSREDWLIQDPLYKGQRLANGHTAPKDHCWVPRTEVLRAANDNAGGTCHVLYGRDTEGVDRAARGTATVRASASASSASLGRLAAGTRVHVVQTENGAAYKAAGGRISTGWHRVSIVGGVPVASKYPGHAVVYLAGPHVW